MSQWIGLKENLLKENRFLIFPSSNAGNIIQTYQNMIPLKKNGSIIIPMITNRQLNF